MTILKMFLFFKLSICFPALEILFAVQRECTAKIRRYLFLRLRKSPHAIDSQEWSESFRLLQLCT